MCASHLEIGEIPMNQSICSQPGCPIEFQLGEHVTLYNGKPYCPAHYTDKLNGDLLIAFQSWTPPEPPPERFLYLLGRVSKDQNWKYLGGDSYLSPTRIWDRGFDFSKTDTGCEFKIVRHHDAQKLGYVTTYETQAWRTDIFAKTLEFFGARDFAEGDIDR